MYMCLTSRVRRFLSRVTPRGMQPISRMNFNDFHISTNTIAMPQIVKIKKRDGTVVDFEKDKIRKAMEKAARAVNPTADLKPFQVMSDHAARHIEIKFKDVIPDVEVVQDLVERTLMEYGMFEVAKAYILYRAEHSKIRKQEVKENVELFEAAKMHYVDEKGKQKPLDKKTLEKLFKKASEGFEKVVDLKALVSQCEGNLYEGMSSEDLGKALVMTARTFIEIDPAYSKITAQLGLTNLYNEVFKANSAQDFDKAYKDSLLSTVKQCVEDKRLVPEMLDFNLEELAAYMKPERDSLFDYLGFQTLYDRYFLREEGGERRVEVPQVFWMRIAIGLALDEKVGDREVWAKKFYDAMSQLHYVPSTPTLFHAGTTYAQLSSCYLNTVEDDLGHIFEVYGDNAQLSKYSGGIGTDWTNVRGTGALIKATNVGSQGVIPFLRIANDVTVAINRSGKRRGATCVYLEVWHYDIEDFLDLRKNTGDERRRTHDMNTANWIPDLFVKRTIEGGEWTLFSPDETPELHHLYGKAFEKKYLEYEAKVETGEIRLFKKLQAKDLWRKMITMLFETGHPWITFKDPCNVRSPQDHVGVVHNSNLCTEITLNTSREETAVCNLGSVNLSRHIKDNVLNHELIKETVTTAMRLLDNVINLNFYPTEEAKVSNMRHRPVGLGIMGFQDALYQMDIDFDTEEAVQFADESMEYISYYAILGSSTLAKERGTYGSYKGSKWDRGIFPVDTLDLLEEERDMPIPVGRGTKLDWKPVRDHVKKHGMRNSNTMAIAPTATISNISGCYPCIEPIYKNLYVKSNMSGEFTVVNEYLVKDLKSLGLWHETMLEELKRNDGSVQNITIIPPRLRNKYKGVFEVEMAHLVKIAAYRGKWIDQSQSFNIFFNGTSGKQLGDIYHLAWHLGLKTTYYLRSLGASSIEKSTIDLARTEAMASTGIEPEIANVKEDNSAEAAVFSRPESAMRVLSEGKACLVSDPNCESCQ
jgi:ribonucleoside-diphosphate reductase alpha chain